MTARDRVVLVGRRKGARVAARRLGLKLVELDHARRPLQASGGYGGTPDEAVAEARNALGDGAAPVAVIAAAEGAVPAAAAIRAAFGLAGVDAAVAQRCHDKLVMKRAVAAVGIRCAPWCAVEAATTAEELIERLGLPVVLKVPVSSGGRGVSIARTAGELARALQPGLLAEGFVDGVEMSVESLVVDGAAVFRNATRYLEPRWANVVPAALPAEIAALADAAHAALGFSRGITHMELFATADGPVFGEIAARPPGGHIMELIRRAYDFDPWEALIRIERGERPSLPAAAARAAGVWVLHPGPGTLAGIDGVDAARAVPGVERVRITAEVGDVIEPRVGSGQTIGEVVAVRDDPDACAEALSRAHGAIAFALA